MYESPITIIKTETDFIKEIVEKTEEECYKAVVKVLPNVNKEELIKALQYDREQYVKGYKDRDSEIVLCKDCKWHEHGGLPCPLDALEGLGDDGYCSRGERK